MSRLEDEAGNAGVLDDVTPAWIGDIVGGAQHGRRWVSITVCPVPDALPLPGTTIGAGHATWPARLHLRQTRLPLATTNRGTVCVLCKGRKKRVISSNLFGNYFIDLFIDLNDLNDHVTSFMEIWMGKLIIVW